MNTGDLQSQIDSRCPCYSKPLLECDCQFNDEDISGLWGVSRNVSSNNRIRKPRK